MHRFLYIVILLITTPGLYAADVTATVTKYNEAELSGDLSSGMSVSFLNQKKNKGTVGQGDTAVFTISGLPACTLTEMVLYAHSNKASGAATVLLTMQDQTSVVAEGALKDWPGQTAYSQTVVPIPIWQGAATLHAGSTLTLTIAGTTNSITVDQWTITFTPAAPVAHTVTLHWVDATHTARTQTFCEQDAGVGVQLPFVTDTVWETGTPWTCVGWSEQSLPTTEQEPQYWEGDNWYMPEYDTHLYGVYTDKQPAWVTQDTTYHTGTYAIGALWNDSLLLWSGGWNDNRIAAYAVAPTRTAAGLYQITTTDLTEDEVYTLTFTADSVIIHSLTGSYIGYSSVGPVRKATPWAWHKADDGSLFIYSEWQSMAPDWKGKAPKIGVDISGLSYICYGYEQWNAAQSFWFLFPVTDLPTDIARWTTFPNLTSLYPTYAPAPVRKVWQKGQIWIIADDIYTIQGQTK